MSLVERALQRMRQTGQVPAAGTVQAGNLAAARPFAHVVDSPQESAPHGAAPVPPRRVVAIDQLALRKVGLLPPEHQERQLAQQYRQVKRPLIASACGKGVPQVPDGRLIMLTSALPGEGKTFMSINLAFSMAVERDLNVLLVDADVAKPHISSLFGLDREPGLLDALRDASIDVESFILPTDIPGLAFLPAGKHSDQATELLSSTRMEDIMHAIGARDPSRIVLFDSPPLLLTTESQVLAHAAGQVVIVVRADVTKQHDVESALSHLSGRPAVSLVLNQSVSAARSGYYYYGYGSGQQAAS